MDPPVSTHRDMAPRHGIRVGTHAVWPELNRFLSHLLSAPKALYGRSIQDHIARKRSRAYSDQLDHEFQ